MSGARGRYARDTWERAARAGRNTVVAIVLALLFACVPVLVGSGRPAFAEDELKENKQELREAKARIRARNQRLKMNQRVMNQLATRIERTEADLVEAEYRIERLGEQMVSLSIELIRWRDSSTTGTERRT